VRAAERDERAREEWRRLVRGLDVRRLVFVDEFGSRIGMARARARAPRGRRAYASLPRNRGPNTTVIASLSLDGLGEAMELEGAVDALAFEAYIERVVGPTLRAGDAVVMDNLPAHKVERVREAVGRRGARSLFLPAYSPDLNPIEEAISKIKGILKGIGALTREELRAAIAEALSAVTPEDALGFFAHCGYTLAHQDL
jgi:transposase